MGADIAQHPAARLRVVEAPPVVRHLGVAVAELTVHVHRRAEAACLPLRADGVELRVVAAVVADGEQALGLLGGPDHCPALGLVHRHGLFAEHMLAGLERGDGLLLVQVVGARDPHHVDRVIGEKGLEVRIALRHAVARAVTLGVLQLGRQHGLEPRASRRVDRRAEDHVAPAPRADHAPADRFRRHTRLPLTCRRRSMVSRGAPHGPGPAAAALTRDRSFARPT